MSDDGANVVRLTDILATRVVPTICHHTRFVVDVRNRIITCDDCKREVEAFETIHTLAVSGSLFQSTYDGMCRDYSHLENYAPHLRAVRELESIWRGKMIPVCPHCRKGVTPEALLRAGTVGRDYAAALEKHERAQFASVTIAANTDGGDDAA